MFPGSSGTFHTQEALRGRVSSALSLSLIQDAIGTKMD